MEAEARTIEILMYIQKTPQNSTVGHLNIFVFNDKNKNRLKKLIEHKDLLLEESSGSDFKVLDLL